MPTIRDDKYGGKEPYDVDDYEPTPAMLKQLKKEQADAKKKAKMAVKIAKTKRETDFINGAVKANEFLAKNQYGHYSVRANNAKPASAQGRYDYEMVRVNGARMAVPVNPVQRNVPVSAVRATGAARSPESLKRDMKQKSDVVYDPRRMSAQQYASWANYPGRSDVVGIDCRSNCKPNRNMKARNIPAYQVRTPVSRSAQIVRVPGGKPVIVPTDRSGNVPRAFLREVESVRPNSARALDRSQTSKRVLSDVGTPYQMRPWIIDPGSCDIRGIDAPENAKVTVRRPRTEAEAKAIQARKNKINGKKGGKATAAKMKAAKHAAKKAPAKKAPAAQSAAKKAPAKAPAQAATKSKLPPRDSSGRFKARGAKPTGKTTA